LNERQGIAEEDCWEMGQEYEEMSVSDFSESEESSDCDSDDYTRPIIQQSGIKYQQHVINTRP